MERSGADLIAWYLSSDRLPAGKQWSCKHAHTQQRLCERFVTPVIAGLACQDIRVADMQRIVNAAPTAQEGGRLHALGAGRGGHPRRIPGQRPAAGGALAGRARPSRGGTEGDHGRESPLFVDPAEIPGHADVAKLGQALAERGSEMYKLMAQLAAYSGLRWGELAALTIGQIDQADRVITVDRKVIGIGGRRYEGAPKNRGDDGGRSWTWHSLRHVFCTTALFTWRIEASDVSRLAGQSNVRITLDLYVGATVGVLDRARSATD